jgi:hypothetical protein
MPNQFLKLRRSAVAGKIPDTSSLELGELAINTFDGQLFLKKSGSQGELVTVVGSTGSFTGSFFGNGAGLSNIPASGIVGLNLSRIATGSITASVSPDVTASFRLTSGSNTLLNVTKNGYVWIGNGLVSNQAYQLDVEGTGRFTSNGNTYDFLVENTATSPYPATSITIASNATSNIGTATLNFKTGNANHVITTWGAYGILGLRLSTNGQTTNTDLSTLFTQRYSDRSTQLVFNYDRGVQIGSYITDEWIYIRSQANTNTSKSFRITATDYSTDRFVVYGDGSTVIGSNSANASAILSISSSTKGFLPTRTNLTSNISNPDQGLLTYITASGDVEGLWQYRTGSGGWVQFLHTSSSIPASSVVGLNLSRIATGSISASVNTDPSASFRLTSGSNTLLNVTKEGYAWIGNGTFVNQAYQLDVQGNLAIKMPSYNSYGFVVRNADNNIDWAFYNNGNNPSNGRPSLIVPRWTSGTPIAIGPNPVSGVSSSIVIGSISNNSLQNNAIVIGSTTGGAVTIGLSSVVIGNYGNVTGNRSIVISTQGANIGNAYHIAHDGAFGIGSAYEYYSTADLQGFLSAKDIYIGRAPRSSSASGNTAQGLATSINGMGGYGISDATGGNLNINGGIGLGAGNPGDIIFGTASPTASGVAIQTLTNRWWIKGSSGTLSNVSNPVSASLYVSGSFVINGTQFNNTSSVTVAGITTVSQLSTGSYTSCFYNYTVASASNARSGQVMTVWNGNNLRYTEVVTTDIGDTTPINVSASISSGLVRLQVSGSAGWTFKNISNLL